MVIQVSYKFASLPDGDLDNFAGNVFGMMSGNATFPTPPATATLAMLDTAQQDFTNKTNAASVGGSKDTEAKKMSRQALLKILRKLAGYVQITAEDREEVLSAGFDTRSANNARSPLEKPTAVSVKNGTAGQLVARTGSPIKNSNLYEGRAKLEGTDTWLPSVFTGDSRHIIFDGLTPGAVYTIEIRALGGSTGQTDWSDPVSHRVM